MDSLGQQKTQKDPHLRFDDQQAVAATEYAIMLSLIVIGSMGVIGTIGAKFHVLYTIIANAVGETM